MAERDEMLEQLRSNFRKFGQQHVEPHQAEIDHADPAYQSEFFEAAVRAGFERCALSEELGGAGLGLAALLALAQELGRICAGHAAALGLHAAGLSALAAVAEPAAQRVLASGRPLALQLPEPLGLDALDTQLKLDEQGRVAGPAGLCLNVAPGGLLLAFALDCSGALAALLIKPDRSAEPERTLGLRALNMAELTLAADSTVQIAAQGAAALALYHDLLRRICLVCCAVGSGLMSAAYEQALRYASERYQGGCMIIEHSHMQEILSGMAAAQGVHSTVLTNLGDAVDLRQALALKIESGEAALRLAADAVQVLGGYGYMRDYGMEKRLRDAETLALLPLSTPRAALLLAALERARL